MLVTFSFTRIAITVRRWFEVGPDATMEAGARVELGLLEPQPHRGSESAAQPLVVGGTFWRADLFGRLDLPDRPYAAAHFHPRFDGPEPSDRVWSEALTEDPWAWLADRLTGIEQTLAEAGLDPAPAREDAEAIRAAAGRIVATARDLGPEQPFTRDDDFRLTRDAALRVRMLVDRVEDRSAVPWDHVRPWLDRADRS